MPLPRPKVPMRTQRDAALLQLGLDPGTAELDHDPALGLRERTPAGGYIPDANDPRYLRWLGRAPHRVKTSGTKATSKGSDVHAIARVKRLTRAQEECRRRMLAKVTGDETPEPRRKWSWPKRKMRGKARQIQETGR